MSFASGIVTTPAKNGTLGSQAGANANQIIFDTTMAAANNGNINAETGFDNFPSRTVILRRGLSNEETRLITKVEVDNLKCTVHEDWVVAPASADTYDLAYMLFDGFGAVRPGAHFFDLNSVLQVSDNTGFAYFFIGEGFGITTNGNGSTTAGDIVVQNQGRFDIGVTASGKSISGGQLRILAGEGSQTDGFLGIEVQSGGEVQYQNTFIQASRDVMIKLLSGAKGLLKSVGMFSAYTMDLTAGASMTYDGFTVEGRRTANDTVLMGGLATYKDMAMISCEAMINASAGVETMTIRGFLSIGNTKEIVVSTDKTWIIVDPNPWDPTSARLDFGAGNTGEVLEKFSLNITVKNPAGVAIQNVRTYIDDETNNLLPTENKIGTDVNGLASSDIKKRRFTFPIAGSFTTETFGAFKLRVFEYGKTPFETDLGAVTAKQVLGVTLIDDAGITLSEASADAVVGVAATKPANPDSIVNYDGGTVALGIGLVVTGSISGAFGTLSEDTGDQVTGKLLLTARNAIAFSDNDVLTDTGTGQAVANLAGNPEQRFTWEVDCNNNTLSDVFHNLDSRIAKATPAAIFLTMMLTRLRLIERSGNDFSTVTDEGEGVLLIRRGAGAVTGIADDAGGSFVPPVSIAVTHSPLKDNSEVRVYEAGTSTQIAGVENAIGGTPDNRTFTWTAAAGTVVDYKIHNVAGYETIHKKNFTVPTSDVTIDPAQRKERNYNDPV